MYGKEGRGQGLIFFRDPDLGGLPGWEMHNVDTKEGAKKYAGRRGLGVFQIPYCREPTLEEDRRS